MGRDDQRAARASARQTAIDIPQAILLDIQQAFQLKTTLDIRGTFAFVKSWGGDLLDSDCPLEDTPGEFRI
jgi:hypothetical protein